MHFRISIIASQVKCLRIEEQQQVIIICQVPVRDNASYRPQYLKVNITIQQHQEYILVASLTQTLFMPGPSKTLEERQPIQSMHNLMLEPAMCKIPVQRSHVHVCMQMLYYSIHLVHWLLINFNCFLHAQRTCLHDNTPQIEAI